MGDLEAAYLQLNADCGKGFADCGKGFAEVKEAVEKVLNASKSPQPVTSPFEWDAVKANREVDTILVKNLFPSRDIVQRIVMVRTLQCNAI
jgi:hypothetical protein